MICYSVFFFFFLRRVIWRLLIGVCHLVQEDAGNKHTTQKEADFIHLLETYNVKQRGAKLLMKRRFRSWTPPGTTNTQNPDFPDSPAFWMTIRRLCLLCLIGGNQQHLQQYKHSWSLFIHFYNYGLFMAIWLFIIIMQLNWEGLWYNLYCYSKVNDKQSIAGHKEDKGDSYVSFMLRQGHIFAFRLINSFVWGNTHSEISSSVCQDLHVHKSS